MLEAVERLRAFMDWDLYIAYGTVELTRGTWLYKKIELNCDVAIDMKNHSCVVWWDAPVWSIHVFIVTFIVKVIGSLLLIKSWDSLKMSSRCHQCTAVCLNAVDTVRLQRRWWRWHHTFLLQQRLARSPTCLSSTLLPHSIPLTTPSVYRELENVV